MQKKALIGHTGFVGGNLASQTEFTHFYNSKNVEDIRNKEFDILVCCGVSAVKWYANKHPEEDYEGIEKLKANIATVNAKRFILISTIDVYSQASEHQDELNNAPVDENNYYGKHRLALEKWVTDNFPKCHIVRLPALIGQNLKKNAIFDLLNQKLLENINPLASFQWYDLQDLWTDLSTVIEHDLKLVNLFPEPISLSSVIDAKFPDLKVGPEKSPAPTYDIKTLYADVFGGQNGYIYSAETSLEKIYHFIDNYGQ